MAGKVFLPAFGNRPRHIIGRQGVIGNFLDGLNQPIGHPDRTTVIVGQRGTGKTTLLLEFAELAEREGFIPVRVAAHKDMLTEIIDAIQVRGSKYLKPSKKQVIGFSAGAAGFSLGISFSQVAESGYGSRMKMSLLCEELTINNRGVVILVDEVMPDAEAVRELASIYQQLIGENINISIAMAGLPASMSSVLNDDILTFLNRANKVYLDPIPYADVYRGYASEFANQDISMPDEVLSKLSAAARGYPYLYQLIGYHVLDLAMGRNLIDDVLANQAIYIARNKMIDNVFSPVLKPLSSRDKDFLTAMSEDKEVSNITDIQGRMGVSKGYAQTYRRRLLEAGIISSPGLGKLEFAVPYLGEYLRGDF